MKETIDELERLERSATAGPWTVGYIRGQCHVEHAHDGPPTIGGTCHYDYTIVADGSDIVAPPNITVCMPNDWGPGMQPNNAALTVAARNALPELIAECREAARLRQEFADMAFDVLSSSDERRALRLVKERLEAYAATAPTTKGEAK